jgi:hypothetical protein
VRELPGLFQIGADAAIQLLWVGVPKRLLYFLRNSLEQRSDREERLPVVLRAGDQLPSL